MTLGEHIQTLRKAAGLSQEALGEKLGVTRQSISKWESDGALPELDKLIAMSRLFGVSVGVLLQVEDPTAEPTAELTDRELRAAEEIAARYLARSKPRVPLWAGVAAACGGAVLLLLCAVSLAWAGALSQAVATVQVDMSGVNALIDTRMNEVQSEVRSMLNEQVSILASSDMELTALDPAGKTASFRLSATLREFTGDTELSFLVTPPGGSTRTVTASRAADSPVFTAEVSLPLSDGRFVLSSVLVKNGELQQSETPNSVGYSDLASACALFVSSELPAIRHYLNPWRLDETVRIHVRGGDESGLSTGVRPIEVGVTLYMGGDVLANFPMDVSESEYSGHASEYTYYVPVKGSYPLVEGKEPRLVVYAVDNLGRRTEWPDWT